MLQVISRGNFLRLVGVQSATLDQRVATGEAAFALGCHQPAHIGEYLVLDAFAMLLASMLNYFTGLELKEAAGEVREHWDGWLKLLTKAERFPKPDHWEQFFAVAWLSLEPRRYRIVMGETDEITAALDGDSVYTASFVSMHNALRQFRTNARLAKPKIALPERLTIDDDEPGYENWRREIDAYRARAEARFQAKAKSKAKGRRPARAGARKRLHPVG